MKCPECRRRMRGNGSRDKRGEIMRHMLCPGCGGKAVTVEKIIAFQKGKKAG